MLGMTDEDMADRLHQLAADIAALFDATPTEALTALQAALISESPPMVRIELWPQTPPVSRGA